MHFAECFSDVIMADLPRFLVYGLTPLPSKASPQMPPRH
jgi:hypothetical protein